MVLQAGALPPLLEQLGDNQKVSMQRNATWTLSNFCRGKPPPDFSVVGTWPWSTGVHTNESHVLWHAHRAAFACIQMQFVRWPAAVRHKQPCVDVLTGRTFMPCMQVLARLRYFVS